jgi:hypothetical protein
MPTEDERARRREWTRTSNARALAAMQANPDDTRHGTLTGYGYGCRCDACGPVGRAYHAADRGMNRRKRFAANLAEMQADPADRRHGTKTGYDYGCRCAPCRAATSRATLDHQIRAKIKPHQHGTTTGYQRGCRCLACRTATAAYRQALRRRTAKESTDHE